MAVELTEAVDWLHQCYSHSENHEHVSVYLLQTADGFVLIDSGSVYHRAGIEAAVDDATDGAGLDAIVLSHSDYPHAGNISALGAETESVELIASSGSPEQQGLPEARKVTIGDETGVQGRLLSFIDPPLADRSHTTWIYDHTDGVLFTADGFGAYHHPNQCDDVSSDYPDGVPSEAMYAYHRDNLVWLRYVDPAKIRTALGEIFETYDVEVIAPVHGPPIVGDDIGPYLERFYDTAARIADEYEIET